MQAVAGVTVLAARLGAHAVLPLAPVVGTLVEIVSKHIWGIIGAQRVCLYILKMPRRTRRSARAVVAPNGDGNTAPVAPPTSQHRTRRLRARQRQGDEIDQESTNREESSAGAVADGHETDDPAAGVQAAGQRSDEMRSSTREDVSLIPRIPSLGGSIRSPGGSAGSASDPQATSAAVEAVAPGGTALVIPYDIHRECMSSVMGHLAAMSASVDESQLQHAVINYLRNQHATKGAYDVPWASQSLTDQFLAVSFGEQPADPEAFARLVAAPVGVHVEEAPPTSVVAGGDQRRLVVWWNRKLQAPWPRLSPRWLRLLPWPCGSCSCSRALFSSDAIASHEIRFDAGDADLVKNVDIAIRSRERFAWGCCWVLPPPNAACRLITAVSLGRNLARPCDLRSCCQGAHHSGGRSPCPLPPPFPCRRHHRLAAVLAAALPAGRCAGGR